MAHQTGITSSDELKAMMSKCLNGQLRYLQVFIKDEQLVPGANETPAGTWENDFDKLQSILDDHTTCYIFYRLDERNAFDNYLWIFLSFTPDLANVREKMLYAATKATLKREFTTDVLVDDLAANSRVELTLEGYKKHVDACQAPPPLTADEQELKLLKESEEHTDVGTSTRQSHLHGIAFPIQTEAIELLSQLKKGSVQYVRLSIDISNETILLDSRETSLSPQDLSSQISDTSPRYHFYRFKNTHEGDYNEDIVFLYSCPGFKSPVKERMLYSSCKQPLVDAVAQEVDLKISKKLEVDGPEDVNEEYLMDALHPKTQAYRQKFSKPKPPGGRKGNNRK